MVVDPKPTRRVRKADQRLDREAAQAWKRAAVRSTCCVTGQPAVHGHHGVSQQELRKAGLGEAERWDLRNLVPLSEGAHRRHHSRFRPVSLSELPASVFEFADEHGFDLGRWYQ